MEVSRLTLNPRKFVEQFASFKAAVSAHPDSDGPFVSFGTGLPRDLERYKDVIYDEGRLRLGLGGWKTEQVGTGAILRRVISAVEINIPAPDPDRRVQNNLVDWDMRFGSDARSHASLYRPLEAVAERFSYESLLYDFYKDELSPDEAFELLVEKAGKRYDFIAYLFFLKDWSRYLPISPSNFDRAFDLLGVALRTSRQCSWENYSSYLGILRQVRDALRIAGLEDVRLVDAHSFCYLLAKLELPETTPPAPILPEPLAIGNFLPEIKPRTTESESAIIDFEARQDEREAIGRLGEEIALESEKHRLRQARRGDLAEKVENVSVDHTKGYDIKSFNEDGTDRFIEVKAVREETGYVSFFLTENERQKAEILPNYFLYLVFGVRSADRKIKYLKAADCRAEFLHPLVHFATVPMADDGRGGEVKLEGMEDESFEAVSSVRFILS